MSVSPDRPNSESALLSISATSWISVFSSRLSGTAVNVPVEVVKVWPIVAPGMSGSASCMPLPALNWNQ